MNAEFKAWLLKNGFRQSGRSCAFWRITRSEMKSERVWLHKNGGQAEIREYNPPVLGARLARLESWKSIEELQEFFGKELEK